MERVLSRRHVSHPIAMTQSYDSLNQLYTETWSVGVVSLSGTKRVRIRNIVNQGFYFKTINAIDTPVTVGLFTSSKRMEDIIAGINMLGPLPPGMLVEADPETGLYTTYTGSNPEITRVQPKELNPYYPHRFAIYQAPEALYAMGVCAKGLIGQMLMHDALLTQGTSYQAGYEINIKSQGAYLYIVPFLASLKKTELACASRIAFDLEEIEFDDEGAEED